MSPASMACIRVVHSWYDLGATRMLGASAVNEFHVSYTRDSNDSRKACRWIGGQPCLAGVCYRNRDIWELSPRAPQQGVENVVFNER